MRNNREDFILFSEECRLIHKGIPRLRARPEAFRSPLDSSGALFWSEWFFSRRRPLCRCATSPQQAGATGERFRACGRGQRLSDRLWTLRRCTLLERLWLFGVRTLPCPSLPREGRRRTTPLLLSLSFQKRMLPKVQGDRKALVAPAGAKLFDILIKNKNSAPPIRKARVLQRKAQSLWLVTSRTAFSICRVVVAWMGSSPVSMVKCPPEILIWSARTPSSAQVRS